MSEEDLQQQADECEALASIYPSEFSVIPSDEWKSISEEAEWTDELTNLASLLVQPQEEDPAQVHVKVTLLLGMPVLYPTSSALKVYVKPLKGLSEDQAKELLGVAQNVAEDNTGMPSVFMVATAVQEWLQENNTPGQDGSMYSDMVRRMQRKDAEQKKEQVRAAIKAAADTERQDKDQIDPEELERIRRRQAGVQVTVESFMAWKVKFEAEMAAKNAKVVNGADAMKITGKQWFLAQQASGRAVGEEDEEAEKLILAGEAEEPMEEDFNEWEEGEDEDDSDYVEEEGDEIEEQA